jgi:hemerythrin
MTHFFEWNSAQCGVNVAQMDHEHQVIIFCMDHLHTLNGSGAPVARLARAIDELTHVTVLHFGAEEDCMASIAYPELAAHRAIHRTLLEKMMEHKAQFNVAGRLSAEFSSFLKLWFKAHICGIDVQYGEYARHGQQRMAA